MIWAMDDATETEEAAVENRISKARAQVFSLFSRIGPSFAFGKKMTKSPNEAPILDGAVKGSEGLRGEISDEPVKAGIKGTPTVNLSLKSPRLAKGKTFLSKIKESILGPIKILFKKPPIRGVSSFAGKRATTITTLHRGRPWGWKIPKGKPKDIHLPATIRAAARNQKNREHALGRALTISFKDIREKVDAITPQYCYILEIIEFMHEAMPDGVTVRAQLGQLRGKIEATKDAAALISSYSRSLLIQ